MPKILYCSVYYQCQLPIKVNHSEGATGMAGFWVESVLMFYANICISVSNIK